MMLLNAPFEEWSPYLFILLAGAVPTQMWRWVGALLASSIDENSEFLKWVKAVATALVAGLIAQLVIFPNGALGNVPLWVRLGAMALGYGVFYFIAPRIIFGILAAVVFLVGGAFLFA